MQAFNEDWYGSSSKASNAATNDNSQDGDANDDTASTAPDVVRPGRFMSTLHATRNEIQRNGDADTDKTAGLLRRLNQIELECIMVLDKMQRATAGAGAATAAS